MLLMLLLLLLLLLRSSLPLSALLLLFMLLLLQLAHPVNLPGHPLFRGVQRARGLVLRHREAGGARVSQGGMQGSGGGGG